MARDYKQRGQYRSKPEPRTSAFAPWWNWLALVFVIVVLPVLLLKWWETNNTGGKNPVKQALTDKAAEQAKATAKPEPPKPEAIDEPRFDFYTILKDKEVVVPDYEIKTRVREERVGKAPSSQYLLQAGSFREFGDADRLRAKLALMGIEARVEKAQVGNVIWNRVKIGPFAQMSSVTAIEKRLKESGIGVMVTEVRN